MTWDLILIAFAITTLGVVFCAVPIYCLLRASDLFGCLDRRASDSNSTRVVPLSPPEALIEDEKVLRFPAQRVPSQMDRAVLTEDRVDQLAS